MGKVTTHDGDVTDEPSQHEEIGAWLSVDELARIDALIPRFSTAARTATRSDVLWHLVLQGFAAEEKRATS